jgi:F-type H+-transporting ATPase subunit b
MDSLISTFHIDWKIIIAQMVNFGIVFFVLYRYAIKPLGKLMEERGNTISKGLTDAKENATKLALTEKEYAEALAQARKEASELITDAKKTAESEKTRIMEQAKTEANNILAQGKTQLEADKAKMLADAKTELADIVIAATEKVLEGTVKGPVESALVTKSINEVTA